MKEEKAEQEAKLAQEKEARIAARKKRREEQAALDLEIEAKAAQLGSES